MRKTLYMDSFIYLIVLRKHKSLSYTTKYKNVNDGVYDDITNDGIRYGVISYCKESMIPKDDWKDNKSDDTANFTGIKSQQMVFVKWNTTVKDTMWHVGRRKWKHRLSTRNEFNKDKK